MASYLLLAWEPACSKRLLPSHPTPQRHAWAVSSLPFPTQRLYRASLLLGAIVRHRKNKDDRGAFCLRRHFAIVNTTAQRVAGVGEQGTHWIVVAFDGCLLDTHAFTVYAWDPMDSDRLLRPSLRSCHENKVLSEFCKVGYSATLARAHVHRFICSENKGLPSLGDLCREVI